MALESLRANRVRSALTMLGVVIGVAAVVLLVAIGGGAKREVETQVQGLGSNLLIIVPGEISFGSAPTTSRLTLGDIDEVARIVGDRRRVAATVSSGENVRAGTTEMFTTLQGTNETVPLVFNRPVARGSYHRRSDVESRRRVAVIGPKTARSLFGDKDPLGRQIAISGVRFRVIGVFAPAGSAFGVDRDVDVHVPITAAQRLLDTRRVDALAVKAPSIDGINELGDRVVDGLTARYPDDTFSAVTQSQILGTVGRILGLLTLVLGAIAGISLLVGGVGVSNIMLVSVRERTREIGLRKAVGARQRDILAQFLIEAVVLTSVGGVVGIVIGIGGALLLEQLTPLPAVIAWWSPVLAFAVSAAVGIFFGVFPARRAGRLDPVVALRSE